MITSSDLGLVFIASLMYPMPGDPTIVLIICLCTNNLKTFSSSLLSYCGNSIDMVLSYGVDEGWTHKELIPSALSFTFLYVSGSKQGERCTRMQG